MAGLTRLRDDPRVRAIPWRDLTTLTPAQKFREVTLTLPWLTAALLLFHEGWVLTGLVASFFFFLTGLRQAHGAQHYCLGLGRRPQDMLLSVLSVLMVASLHALQATHMHHHRHMMEPSDIEAVTARMPWWKALVLGPWFIVALHCHGYRLARPSQRRWILGEGAAVVAWVAAITWGAPPALQWFMSAMIAGECLTGFFAVWSVHHDCDPVKQIARTQRGAWKNLVSHDMFYHLEHHLFPAVPTPRLPELAARLDAALPEASREHVF